ncbi:NTP transferase domain-containing protein [Shewanella sp. NFH-SH190041]|uniref:NTP transferase domain-containing protein n=1 Tax=Shewanella sp. NFH-SH190041 TaxID=2950245 RepID=UPI0021C27471|nr:NTP transferase domain-containing protein [Shewanella sp. NFH-SH190041]
MSIVTNAVIAAAGMGSRIGLGMPKCMIEIQGVTLLSRMLAALVGQVEHVFLVVGYRENLVAEYCRRHHPEVILVRNPDFATTNTAASYGIAARYLQGKTLFIDGDLIVNPASLAAFLQQAEDCPLLVGITPASSDNAVLVSHQGDTITGFTAQQGESAAYEWANLFVGDGRVFESADGFVYESLNAFLPARCAAVELCEIDTQADYQRACAFVQTLDYWQHQQTIANSPVASREKDGITSDVSCI